MPDLLDPSFDREVPGLLSQRLRLVYPFRVPRSELSGVAGKLENSGIWKAGDLNEEFRKEMLDSASSFVFGAMSHDAPPYYFRNEATFDMSGERSSTRKAGPRYSCFLNGDHGIRWLLHQVRREHNSKVKDRDRPTITQFEVNKTHAAEIFLNPFGCGVVTLTLERLLPPNTSWGDLLDFVYHISHIRRRPPLIWREDPTQQLAQITFLPAGMTPTGALNAFTEEGLVVGSGPSSALASALQTNAPFTMGALFRELIAPISHVVAGEQGQFMVYSVVEFDHTADFSDPAPFLPPLCVMAQLEEASHPPTVPGQEIVETLASTTRHLVGASSMGVVHFVARQFPRSIDYDEDRAPRLLVKYFASTLAAYFQLVGVNAYQGLSVAILSKPAPDTPKGGDEVVSLSREVSHFTASANLALINRREAHNRYYHCLRRACHVEAALLALQRSLRDISLAQKTHNQSRALSAIQEIQDDLRESDSRLGNLELFIILVYSIEMANIFGELTQARHGNSLAVAATGVFVAFFLVLLLVKHWPGWLHPWMPEKDGNRHRRWMRVALAFLFAYFLALLAPQFARNWQRPSETPPRSKSDSATPAKQDTEKSTPLRIEQPAAPESPVPQSVGKPSVEPSNARKE